MGIFPTVARINHSCKPNAHHFYNPDTGEEEVGKSSGLLFSSSSSSSLSSFSSSSSFSNSSSTSNCHYDMGIVIKIYIRCGLLRPFLLVVRSALVTFAHFVGSKQDSNFPIPFTLFRFCMKISKNIALKRSLCDIRDDLDHIFAAEAIGSSYYRKNLAFPARASNAGETLHQIQARKPPITILHSYFWFYAHVCIHQSPAVSNILLAD